MPQTPLALRTLDAHTAGEPLRLVLDGWPAPRGRTMLERREWARRHQDDLRRILMFEPRGHADMYGALLTEPERTTSDAGVLFMHNEGFSTMCGHGVIAVVTMAVERGLIHPRSASAGGASAGRAAEAPASPTTEPVGAGSEPSVVAITLDAPAGEIRARAEVVRRPDGRLRVVGVSFVNVPSFVFAPAVPITVNGRPVLADVAFGGAFYAVVDAESVGLAVLPQRLPELRAAGMAVKRAVEAAVTVVHPTEPGLAGIYGTIFTAPPSVPDADLRNVTIFADHEVDRSPCGTGTCAVLAVLDAMGVVDPGRPFVHESIIGTTFRARVVDRGQVGDLPAIVPELTGEAWITGEHTFLADPEDPVQPFRLSETTSGVDLRNS